MDLKHLIDRQELLKLLCDLISINSVNPEFKEGDGEKEIADYVGRSLEQWGIAFDFQEVSPNRSNVIGRIGGTDQSRSLLFEAHMDTVSSKGMSIDPFRPEIKDGRIYGRGSCDTKAGLAAMLCAMRILKEADMRPRANICLAAVVDEEVAFRGVAQLIRSGISANGAVVSEPTELRVVIAHKGCLRWRITTKGRAVHSSKPHLGINAISKMAKLISAIDARLPPLYHAQRHPLVGAPTVSIGLIDGGVEINTVPDRCSIEIDRRVIPGETSETIRNEFASLLQELAAGDPDFQAVMEDPWLADPPLETREEERIVRTAREACTQTLGEAEVCGVPYGTDASKLSQAGIPSIVLGPGSIDQAHTAAEYVEADQVSKAAEVYARIMLQF